MSRTRYLGGAVLGALMLAPGSAFAQESFNLTFQSAYPAGDPQFLHFQEWAEDIARYSGGRLNIETLPAGAVVPAFEVLDATHDEVIDGAHAWSGFWVGKDRAAVMVSSGPAGPFGMDWSDMWGWYYQGGGLDEVNWFFQEHLELDVIWRPLLSSGAQPLGWFNREIESVEDMQGLRLRIPGIPGEMYEGMGVSVITLPGGEIVPAGERGVIDAAEFVGPWIDFALGFQDIWQIYYAPAYHEVVTVGEVLINKSTWESLPEDLQHIYELVTEVSMLRWEQKQQRQDKIHMDRMAEDGVEFRRTPEDVLEQSLEVWHRILEEDYTTNPAFKRLVDSQLEWASYVVPAKRILEPDFNALADLYWGPDGFIAQAEFLDFEWTVPDYYATFAE
ncbi:MAG: TRAP transporter substrate-binding protein [Salinarimonas sp.]|nr:TRAP transporter substrate-binding protein [Salinarimonas sp.]